MIRFSLLPRRPTIINDLLVLSEVAVDIAVGTPIYIGPTNVEHMEREHPYEFELFFNFIPKIISEPDFVGQNPKDGSIEYIKSFPTNAGQYLKLAVRISNDNFLFARSLYEILERTVRDRVKKVH